MLTDDLQADCIGIRACGDAGQYAVQIIHASNYTSCCGDDEIAHLEPRLL